MQRRKFLIGAGSIAAGSAAAMGTGAFSSVTATRTVSVNVADDASAYLRLEGRDQASNNEEYIEDDGEDGTLELALNGDDTAPGSGVNPDAITEVDDLFLIQNQGTQPVDVSLNKFGDNPGVITFYANENTDASGQYDTSSGSTTALGSGSMTLDTGETVYVSLEIDTEGSGLEDGDNVLDSVTVTANA